MMPPPVPATAPNYSESIDFHELVQLDGEFKRLLVANAGRMDWKNPEHVMQLTKCLLKRDFALSIELPEDRLCPPVPGRYSYIQWIQSLLDTTSGTYMDSYDSNRQVVGIDVGTGASCIYPLLGTVVRPKWRFFATEMDAKSHSYALKNVEANDLTSRIKVIRINPLEGILPLDRHGIHKADFTMCNPPFYASESEMLATFDKNEPPSAVCTGAEVEMITEGGDAGFVVRMVNESKELGSRVQWYTSMLGKLSSVSVVTRRLKDLGCVNWAVGCLLTGGKTRRWVVGWSWGDFRPTSEIARCDVPNKDLLPFPTIFTVNATGLDKPTLATRVNNLLNDLDIRWQWRASMNAGVALAKENVWSRAARRKKRLRADRQSDEMDIDGAHGESDHSMDTDSEVAALALKISIHEEKVEVRWLKGIDSVMFESFCGMLKRELTK